MEKIRIDINNEEDILRKFDIEYCRSSEKCSTELCKFFNDIKSNRAKNFNSKVAYIDLARIAITLRRQHRQILELECKLLTATNDTASLLDFVRYCKKVKGSWCGVDVTTICDNVCDFLDGYFVKSGPKV